MTHADCFVVGVAMGVIASVTFKLLLDVWLGPMVLAAVRKGFEGALTNGPV